jgi:hypothetical protein
MRGYIVVYVAFYERAFTMPSHRFLRSLLHFYGLELPLLTPSGILHMAAFITLCEAYMGMEPHFNLWNYFFHAWLGQGSGTEAVVLGHVDIFVRSRLQKVWFFLCNNPNAPLSVFMGSRPIPQPNWGYAVARIDLRMLEPLCEP